MKKIVAGPLMLFLSLAAFGQSQFDSHDFSGFWAPADNGGHAIGNKAPPLTPAGVAAMKGRIPDSRAGIGNAPWYQCNPMGFPRLVNDKESIEIVMDGKARILELFQWEHTLREIWTDGRVLPSGENLENLGPAWYGHSVGQWQGDTLVVNTVGLDERAWLDNAGNPKSFHARIEERFKRIGPDHIEYQITLYDPEFYTAPWAGAVRTYHRLPKNQIEYFGWKGLFSGLMEQICAPMNEVEDYNKRFRDPANGIIFK